MTAVETPTVLAAFLTGFATVLTPCSLPTIPAILAGGRGHRLRPVAVVAGSLLAFTALGVLVGTVGGVSVDALRLPFVAVMLVFGAVLADDDLHERYSAWASRVGGRVGDRGAEAAEGRPLAGGFLLGTLLGFLWLPCVGPVIGAVLAYAGATGDAFTSGWLLFWYGLGFGVPLVGVGYGGRRVGAWLSARALSGRRPALLRRTAGLAVVLTAVGLLFELDRLLLSLLVGS